MNGTNGHVEIPASANTKPFGPDKDAAPAEEVTTEIQTPADDIRNLMSLAGGAVLVTGGARGLGLCIASGCIEAGADVYCSDLLAEPSDSEWDALAAKAKQLGRRLEYFGKVDICNAKQINQLYSDIAAKRKQAGLPPINGLLHAAATNHEQDALDYDMQPYEKVVHINVVGAMIVAQAAARIMKESGQGGSMVLIASISGFIANRGIHSSGYQASKAAVHQLARSLAVEWGQYGIRVNTISPGYIRTAMSNALLVGHPNKLREWEDSNPLGRIALPYEVKAPAILLLSKGASFVNGTDIRIDGGHTAW